MISDYLDRIVAEVLCKHQECTSPNFIPECECGWEQGDDSDEGPFWFDHAAVKVTEAVEAACKITDVQQLADLPDGSVIYDDDEDVMLKSQGNWYFWGDESNSVGRVHLPALLVKRGES